jgi:hypothetical protein
VSDRLRGIIVASVLIIALFMSLFGAFVLHKCSMENIAGHPVSWWDAFWTY